MTYCRQKDQIRVLSVSIECLEPGGLLIIGSLESLPLETEALVQTAGLPYVFRKK